VNGHPTREEDFDLYALGVMEGEERQAIEAHLEACAECSRKLEEARGRIALLALAVPQVAPNPRLKERLMAHVGGMAPRFEAQEQLPPAVPEKVSIFANRWWAAILTPLVFALATATVVLWIDNEDLQKQVRSLRASVQEQQNQLAYERGIINAAAEVDTLAVNLAPPPNVNGRGMVRYNERHGMVLLNAVLAPLPAEKTYQLWLVPTQGNPVSLGIFTPEDTNGSAYLVGSVPAGTKAKAFAVTVEASGGVPQPTGPKVLIGPVS
jgi:anti-sigma-K factor RskA